MGCDEVDGAGYLWGPGQVVVLPQAARTFVYREQRAPEDMQIRIAAVESQGRPAGSWLRVYQLRPESSPGAAPEFASCATFALGCFIVQTFGTSMAARPAAVPHDGPSYLAIHPARGTDVTWPPPSALGDHGLDQFTHPLQPVTPD